MATQAERVGRPVGGIGGMFRALYHRNYRLFWAGAVLSNVGTWMQAVAQGLLVYDLTHSAFWLGLDGFMATAPGLVLTLAGGVFADLLDRKRLLIYTQIGAGLSALALAALVMTHVIHPWMVLCLSFVTGSCMSLAGPSYQAITFDLVGREDLANAIALNSMQFQLSRVIGPSLAGLALNYFGVAGCFLANGVSYIAIIIGLWMIRLERTTAARLESSGPGARGQWENLINGFRYVRGRPRVFGLLMISAVTSLFGAPYMTMIPVFAREIFNAGDTGLALMIGTAGAGAFTGALVLMWLGDFKNKGRAVLAGAFVFSICLIGFSLSTFFRLSLVFLFGIGFAIVFSFAGINTLLQQLVTDELRGRVMSLLIFSFIGCMPFGNIIAGAASNRFGAPHTLAIGGAIIAIYIVVLTIRNKGLREM